MHGKMMQFHYCPRNGNFVLFLFLFLIFYKDKDKDKDKDKNKKNEKQTSLKFINNNFGKAFRFMQISPETDSKFSFKNFYVLI